MKDINQITFCALINALSVALMFLGTIFCHSSMLVAAVCGYLNLIIAKETRFYRALCSYFVVLLLTSLFITRKSVLIDYALFSGIYPIIETKISKIKNIIIKVMFKFVIFSICSFVIIQLNLLYLGLNNSPHTIPIQYFFISMVIAFYSFDALIQDINKIYAIKIRPKILKQFI